MVTNAESQLIPWEVLNKFQSNVLKFNQFLATEFLTAKFSHIPGTVGESQLPLKWDA